MLQDRTAARWITGGNRAAHFELHMMITVQGLGSLDRELTAFDRFLVTNVEEIYAYPDDQAIGHAVLLTRHLTLSYLWVLGAYEVIRSIDQRFFSGNPNGPDTYEIKATKRQFSRLRVPLAKYEAERRSPGDSSIAYPALSAAHGAAWMLSESVLISREELAEAFLTMLEGMPAQFALPTRTP